MRKPNHRVRKMFSITPSTRLRTSPYYEATRAEGVCAMTPYNTMLLPTSYGDPEGEYWRLINGVAMWDVAAQRQVQLKGPDAGRLAQILAPRDLSKCKVEQGKYVPLCNHNGVLINDPVLLKRSEDCFWLSVADSNIWLWADAIARERGLDVEVSEPDVSPLAVQGPKAETVVASIFGDWVRDLKYFWFREAEINGIPVAVQRSGWSKQGGFELYLMDGIKGTALWNIVKEAGAAHDIGPGNPNWVERVESGLLAFGGDTDDQTNPFEVRMGKYVDLDVPDDTIGIDALRNIAAEGPKRHQLGIKLDGDAPTPSDFAWTQLEAHGTKIGDMTACAWSHRLKQNIGIVLASVDAKPGDMVSSKMASGIVQGQLCELPFL